MPNIQLATQNLTRAALNRLAKLQRHGLRRSTRAAKRVRESTKDAKAGLRGLAIAGRDATSAAYTGSVRLTRYWRRVQQRTLPRVVGDAAVRLDLWRAARGSGPIVVGPWLSEVGYEVLYWIPFLRWFVDYYRVDPARVIAVSRGGVSGWYEGIAERYVELLDLYRPEDLAARNRARQDGAQKQFGISSLDQEIVDAVQQRLDLSFFSICHPSAMFRLLRQFWLGNESLDYALSYLRYARMSQPSRFSLPPLPESFVAMKFYTARSLESEGRHKDLLRALVEQIARRHPVVLLNTGLSLDEHEDCLFTGVPGVTSVGSSMRPENNLAIQTEIIRRADRFVGTCGSVAWLAPMLGTDTLAVYADDHLLTSHLYAARHGYASMDAGRFSALDLNALAQSGWQA